MHKCVELVEDVDEASGEEQISDDSEDSAEEEASLAKLPIMSTPLEQDDPDTLLMDLLKSTKYGTVHKTNADLYPLGRTCCGVLMVYGQSEFIEQCPAADAPQRCHRRGCWPVKVKA